jgi:hypothetical protein
MSLFCRRFKQYIILYNPLPTAEMWTLRKASDYPALECFHRVSVGWVTSTAENGRYCSGYTCSNSSETSVTTPKDLMRITYETSLDIKTRRKLILNRPVLCKVTPCHWESSVRSFGGSERLHVQDQVMQAVTSQKTWDINNTAVGTSNVARFALAWQINWNRKGCRGVYCIACCVICADLQAI